MSSVFGGTRIYTFLSDGSVVASQTLPEGGDDVCGHPELTRTALGVLRVASGSPASLLEISRAYFLIANRHIFTRKSKAQFT